MTPRQAVYALIYEAMVKAWLAPLHVRSGGEALKAWAATFIDAVAALNPSEAEARAAFLAVSQAHKRADWPPASAFVAAIHKARQEAHGGHTAGRPTMAPLGDLKREAARLVDDWLSFEAEWVTGFLAGFSDQQPSDDRGYALWHLTAILRRKAWVRAQRDALNIDVELLEITEADARTIRERVESQPYDKHKAPGKLSMTEAVAMLGSTPSGIR